MPADPLGSRTLLRFAYNLTTAEIHPPEPTPRELFVLDRHDYRVPGS